MEKIYKNMQLTTTTTKKQCNNINEICSQKIVIIDCRNANITATMKKNK